MHHCPNPECPFAKRFGRPAEYRPGFDTCSDCGASLAEGTGQEAPAPSPASPSSDAGSRLAVSVVVMLLVAVGVQLPVLGITMFDRHGDGLLDLFTDSSKPGLLDIGVAPFISAFQLVELFALLPFLAARRVGSPKQRRPLTTAAMMLGFAVLVMQAWSLSAWAQGLQSPEYAMAKVETWFFAGCLAPSFVLLGAVWLVDVKGLGNGFAVVIAGTGVGGVVNSLLGAWSLVLQERLTLGAIVLDLVVVGALVAALVRLTAWRSPPSHEAPKWVPLPLSGVLPPTLAGAVMAFPALIAGWVPFARPLEELIRYSSVAWTALFLFLVADFTLVCGWLFFRPSSLREQWARWLPGVAGDRVQEAARHALPVGLAVSVAVTCGYAVLSKWLSSSPGQLLGQGGLLVVASFVVFADLADEWEARRKHGALEPVTELYRVTEVEPLLAALAQANIPAHAKSARLRALLRFFGPHVPITVLVPAAQAKEAKALVERA